MRDEPLETAQIEVNSAGELPEETPYHARMAETICEANEPVRIHPGDETMCMTFFVALHAAITKGHGEKPGEAVSYAKAVVRAAREVFE